MKVKKPSLQQNFTLNVHKYFLLLCLPYVNPIIKMVYPWRDTVVLLVRPLGCTNRSNITVL